MVLHLPNSGVELEFGNVRGENLAEHGRADPTTNQPTYMVSMPGFEPGRYWWEASDLTTLLLLPRKWQVGQKDHAVMDWLLFTAADIHSSHCHKCT